MIRSALMLILLTALGARADELRGRVTTDAGGVQVGERPVAGALAPTLALFAGREVTVDATRATTGRWLVSRIVSPERLELRGRKVGAALATADHGRVTLTGPAAALVADERVCIVDAYLFGREAVVLAVEGRTTGEWNLVHVHSRWRTPFDVVRGERPVWVVGRRDGRWLVRRGDTSGWMPGESVVIGEAPVNGLIDAVTR
jgi:hypothetical protein